jgi:two-component system cell cycle sensor histidine kinase/response regulator CckA
MEDKSTAVYSVPRGTETILVAEDDEMLRALLGISLESCGYTVLMAADGPEALRLAELHDGPIALLISDLVMRGMDGCQLARRLTSIRPDLTVLLLSGYNRDPRLAAGFAFLQKPCRPSALVARVREILDAAPARRARDLIDHPPPRAATSSGGQDVEKLEACACR